MARRKSGEYAHVFASAADLQAIQASYQCAHNQHLSNVETIVTQKKGGAAQANRSARSSSLGWVPTVRAGNGNSFKAGFININSIRPRIEKLRMLLAENATMSLE